MGCLIEVAPLFFRDMLVVAPDIIDENVNVAVVGETVAQDGTEQRQAPTMVASTQSRELLLRDADPGSLHGLRIARGSWRRCSPTACRASSSRH